MLPHENIQEEGREEGREEEHYQMIIQMVDSAMTNFHVDLEAACKGLGITVEEYHIAKDGITK